MQLQFENGVCLLTRERFFRIELRSTPGGVDVDLLAAEIHHQMLAGIGTISAAADNRDDIVQMIERREITFEDVLAVARLRQ